MKKRPVFFLHVPKAGGTSLRSLIESEFTHRDLATIYRTGKSDPLIEILERINRNKGGRFKYIYGHVPYTPIVDFFGPLRSISIVRDPVNRFLSFYSYVRYDFKDHNMHEKLKNDEVTFQNILKPNFHQHNLMCKLFSGHETTVHARPDMIETAKKNVDEFAYIASVENYNQDIKSICEVTGLPRSKFKVKNKSSVDKSGLISRLGISEADLNKLADLNSYDYELYDYIRTKFN